MRKQWNGVRKAKQQQRLKLNDSSLYHSSPRVSSIQHSRSMRRNRYQILPVPFFWTHTAHIPIIRSPNHWTSYFKCQMISFCIAWPKCTRKGGRAGMPSRVNVWIESDFDESYILRHGDFPGVPGIHPRDTLQGSEPWHSCFVLSSVLFCDQVLHRLCMWWVPCSQQIPMFLWPSSPNPVLC
jgi:hypothetical protein